MCAFWGHIRFQLLPGELPKDWGLGHGWHLPIRKKHSVDGCFSRSVIYPWRDASCSEFQNIHCHQATECFETIIHPWVRMTYHSRCTSSSQSCHHLLSPWLWWNSWWGFFGWGLKVENAKNTILQDHSRGEQRKCPGRQLGVQRVANAQGRSCDTPDMESRWSSLVICWDLRWLGDHFLAEKSCITLWPNGQESSNDYSWHEWADKKVCWKLNFVLDAL